MLELAYVVAVVVAEPERTVEVEDSVERGIKTLLELELTAFRGMVAMMLGMGFMAKMSLELLQQARLPGPWPWVSQQLGEYVSYTIHLALSGENGLFITG
jgi:hypothetical protein